MRINYDNVTPEMVQLLKLTGSNDTNVAFAAQRQLAKAIELPLRKGVLRGDSLQGIFTQVKLEPGATSEWPLDILAPGTEKDFVAYTIPNQGRIPESHFEGDYVTVPTYDVGSSCDWLLKFGRDARWDVAARALEVMRGTVVRKDCNDGWHTLLAAGVGRNLAVYDASASQGFFTKRLVVLAKTVMRRNAGGNASSASHGIMTDVYGSPEAAEDIRLWDLTQIDDITRREIFVAGGGDTGEEPAIEIFNVKIHILDELGVGQEYQLYYTNVLGGTLQAGKQEILVGLDLRQQDSFIQPIRAELEIFPDETLHRQRRAGYYCWKEGGFSVLDSRRVLLLQI